VEIGYATDIETGIGADNFFILIFIIGFEKIIMVVTAALIPKLIVIKLFAKKMKE
jgi:hypothetical protein